MRTRNIRQVARARAMRAEPTEAERQALASSCAIGACKRSSSAGRRRSALTSPTFVCIAHRLVVEAMDRSMPKAARRRRDAWLARRAIAFCGSGTADDSDVQARKRAGDDRRRVAGCHGGAARPHLKPAPRAGEAASAPHPRLRGHLLPARRREGRDDPPRAALRRTGGDDEFFVSARGLASRGDGRARGRAGACGDRDRGSQHARRRRARACLRARERGGDGGHARRSRRAARLRRRRAGHARLSEKSRGLRPALPDPDGGKFARAQGRMPAELEDLLEHGEGLQIVALPFSPSGDGSPQRRRRPLSRAWKGARARRAHLARLREAFGPRLWIGASLTYGEDMRGGARAARGAGARKSARRCSRPTTR